MFTISTKCYHVWLSMYSTAIYTYIHILLCLPTYYRVKRLCVAGTLEFQWICLFVSKRTDRESWVHTHDSILYIFDDFSPDFWRNTLFE